MRTPTGSSSRHLRPGLASGKIYAEIDRGSSRRSLLVTPTGLGPMRFGFHLRGQTGSGNGIGWCGPVPTPSPPAAGMDATVTTTNPERSAHDAGFPSGPSNSAYPSPRCRVASFGNDFQPRALARLEITSSVSSLGAEFLPLLDGGTPQRLVLASAHICFSR